MTTSSAASYVLPTPPASKPGPAVAAVNQDDGKLPAWVAIYMNGHHNILRLRCGPSFLTPAASLDRTTNNSGEELPCCFHLLLTAAHNELQHSQTAYRELYTHSADCLHTEEMLAYVLELSWGQEEGLGRGSGAAVVDTIAGRQAGRRRHCDFPWACVSAAGGQHQGIAATVRRGRDSGAAGGHHASGSVLYPEVLG